MGWLLGEGEARGIALICLFAGLIMVVAASLAFFTRSYRTLTELYATAPDPAPEEAQAQDSAVDDAEGAKDRPDTHRDAPPIVPGIPPESR